VNSCLQQYTALQSWVTQENAYQAAVTRAHQQHKSTSSIPKPGPQPPKAAAMCPPSAAFGIAAGDLVPTATGHS
jgi:hypothetical protein